MLVQHATGQQRRIALALAIATQEAIDKDRAWLWKGMQVVLPTQMPLNAIKKLS
jgi:hypothetical protein